MKAREFRAFDLIMRNYIWMAFLIFVLGCANRQFTESHFVEEFFNEENIANTKLLQDTPKYIQSTAAYNNYIANLSSPHRVQCYKISNDKFIVIKIVNENDHLNLLKLTWITFDKSGAPLESGNYRKLAMKTE